MSGKSIINVVIIKITLYFLFKDIRTPLFLKSLIEERKYMYKKIREFYNPNDSGKKRDEGLAKVIFFHPTTLFFFFIT